MRLLIVLFLLLPLIYSFTMSPNPFLPPNSCPQYFQYKYTQGIYFGELKIPFDGNPILDLNVNVSMIGLFRNLKLNMELLSQPNEILTKNYIKYKVNFPLQTSIPKITEIKFNNVILCYSDGFLVTSKGVTNLWSRIFYELHSYTVPISKREQETIGEFSTAIPTITTTMKIEKISQQEIINKNEPNDDDVTEKCGIPNNVQSLILNGDTVEENEFPWLAALFRSNGLTYDFQCTANLISKNYILTAAHCVQFYKAPLVPLEDLLIIIGRSNLTRWATSDAIIRSAIQIKTHPDYRQFSGHCDVALIKLNEPIIKPLIYPICLTDDQSFNKTGTVAGWGLDENGNKAVPDLRKIKMPMVTQETCLRSDNAFYNLTSPLTFCAGSKDGSGPCTGDSGAGFMLKNNNKWYLRGVVSAAKRGLGTICNLNDYVVFADISKLFTWIKSSISDS